MITVTCAIIRNDENKVLVVQRGEQTDHPFKWEFPGGKLRPGESEEECIIREITEELSIGIVICSRLKTVRFDYGHKQISLIPFICDTLDELPFLSEHIAFKWIAPEDLKNVDFSEADIIVADNYLQVVGNVREDKTAVMEQVQSPVNDEELRSMVERMISLKEVQWVATSAIENPAIFNKLLEYSFSDDRKLAFRTSWILTKVCDKNPEIIYPNLPRITEVLGSIDNESVQRSFLRIISMSDMNKLTEAHHGLLADHCFSALRSGSTAIAIKAYSMEILYRLALIYPELANELAVTINILRGEGSAGIIARGTIILKKLAEMPEDPGSRRQ
ncbi:MAG: (deoxy)nucleoside triphosphate pyrophosphohydrolase [Bacteroidales bacterium]|nr:(deoxy)nucleoside triphosphate pyrophosphohydrolase [Bacteroidales bacterium]